jgi:hypothetical protein
MSLNLLIANSFTIVASKVLGASFFRGIKPEIFDPSKKISKASPHQKKKK